MGELVHADYYLPSHVTGFVPVWRSLPIRLINLALSVEVLSRTGAYFQMVTVLRNS